MILDPTKMDFIQWTNQLTLQLDKFGPTMKLVDINEWQMWALNVMGLIGLSPVYVNPMGFEDPTEWAVRFTQDAEFLINV